MIRGRRGGAYRIIGMTGAGDILREAIKNNTATGRQAEPYLKSRKLVPDEIVNSLIAVLFHVVNRPDRFVFEGYPRTVSQTVCFEQFISNEKLPLDSVIAFCVVDVEVVRRISGRCICVTRKAVFALMFVRPEPLDYVIKMEPPCFSAQTIARKRSGAVCAIITAMPQTCYVNMPISACFSKSRHADRLVRSSAMS